MGNRAVITTPTFDASTSTNLGIYLHWNGGRDSVEAFLAYCKLKGHRAPESDCYGWARLCQVIGNYFGGETSIGIDKCHKLDCDNFDNGVYFIEKWEITGRQFQPRSEQTQYPLKEMLKEINACQPEKEQLEEKIIDDYCSNLEAEKQQRIAGDDAPAVTKQAKGGLPGTDKRANGRAAPDRDAR